MSLLGGVVRVTLEDMVLVRYQNSNVRRKWGLQKQQGTVQVEAEACQYGGRQWHLKWIG